LLLSGSILVAGLLLLAVVIKVYQGRPPTVQEAERPAMPPANLELATGKQLYGNYCASCHGEQGDGNGPAARYLYPKPRDFGEAKFRLASTVNAIPSDQDLLHVITRGMPGSAMFPFAHLSEADRKALVVYVRHLTQTAFVARLRQQAVEQGDTVNLEELTRDVEELLRPGEDIVVPSDLPAPSTASVARGHDLYLKICSSCHGQTGKGDGAQDQRDDKGVPSRPRDFGRGIFKGGREPQQIYTRIFLGMRGTPMPSSSRTLTSAESGDLVNFILSLSDASAQAKVEQKRRQLIAKRVAESLPEEISEEVWRSVEAVPIVVSPLWWRDYPEPDLQVSAVHDGRSLAIRLTWDDATRNDRVVRPQDFEDMAAVQLFKGAPEPFLGMGAAGKPVDVWLWRASGHSKPSEYIDVDTAYPNMAVDFYPFERPANDPRSHPTELQSPPFLTARAAGNQRSDPSQPFIGSNLQAQGFGSLSMRPRVSQAVATHGKWQNGRWTVVLRRPLTVNSDTGVVLASGDRLSIAFAIWDGAAGDRNGQKLVSIWHDLQLE
jgi:mono/diheme cytochrome c family protein